MIHCCEPHDSGVAMTSAVTQAGAENNGARNMVTNVIRGPWAANVPERKFINTPNIRFSLVFIFVSASAVSFMSMAGIHAPQGSANVPESALDYVGLP
jgi:hypothetical protein